MFTGKYDYAWVYYIGNNLAGVLIGLLWRGVYMEKKPVVKEEGEVTEALNPVEEVGA